MSTKKTRAKSTKKTTEVVIKVQAVPPTVRDLEPVTAGGKYMIPKTWMSERQVLRLVQKTPAQHVYTRPAKGGGQWSYVTGSYVEKVLNFTFGWNWDFEVMSHGHEQGQVWVLGKLTVKDDRGHQIIKSQFGRADIKYRKNTKEMLDYGNDLKSACTDSLKKCSSLLGIASDIYGKAEFKQEANIDLSTPQSVAETPKTQPLVLKSGQVLDPDGKPTYLCSKCDSIITDSEADYSLKLFKKRLCRNCQTNK